jgi:hypothetical protein
MLTVQIRRPMLYFSMNRIDENCSPEPQRETQPLGIICLVTLIQTSSSRFDARLDVS